MDFSVGDCYYSGMKYHSYRENFEKTISSLAAEALKRLPPGTPAFEEAKVRRTKPMDYLRCVEFPLSREQLRLKSGMKILDVASPQWFSLCLAQQNPEIEFVYINILREELDQIQNTAECLRIHNIQYRVEDCRGLSFENKSFDGSVSISTIEHIAPDIGGDKMALREINRILKQGGEFVLSVPFKRQQSLMYDDKHPVWEKPAQAQNFYMRNYDSELFEELIKETSFELREKAVMYEKPGLFAMQYWECEGKNHPAKNTVIKLKKKIDKAMGLRLEKILSRHYIKVDNEAGPFDSPINLVATLIKK